MEFFRQKVLFWPTFYCLAIDIKSFNDIPGWPIPILLVDANWAMVTVPK